MEHIDAIRGKRGYWHIIDFASLNTNSKYLPLCGCSIELINMAGGFIIDRECSLETNVKNILNSVDCPQCLKRYQRKQEREKRNKK